LYGLTSANGHIGIFEIDPTNDQYSLKHEIEDSSGPTPLLAVGEKLLGATLTDGDTFGGYIYEYSIASNTFINRTSLADDPSFFMSGPWLLVKRGQQITFNPSDQTFSSEAIALEGSSTSGLPVTYSTTSDKLTIDGNHATMVKPGRVSITASQPGDDNFNPAMPKEASFCINPVKPTISGGIANSINPVTLTSSSDTGNTWFKDGVAITGATSHTYAVTESGAYTVSVSADDCVSDVSTATTVVITGLEDESTGVRVYPNPTSAELFVEIPVSTSPVNVNLVDMLGRVIESRGVQSNTTAKFEISGLKPAIYLVRIAKDGKMINKKIVKQ
jgi:hypothetical protein